MNPPPAFNDGAGAADASEVPEGAAVFPLIPDELGIHPLLLACLHAIVFFDGSDADVVNDAAADEALQYLATYLQRLQGADLKRFEEDIECLVAFGGQEGWPREVIRFLKTLADDYGIGNSEQQ